MGSFSNMAAASDVADITERLEANADPRECYGMVRELIAARKNRGEMVPEELVRLERSLFAECNAQSQGR